MTDVQVTPAFQPLLIIGDPTAAACEGDFCAVPHESDSPQHHEQAVVNRALDSDLV